MTAVQLVGQGELTLMEKEARARIALRDERDWPAVAAAFRFFPGQPDEIRLVTSLRIRNRLRANEFAPTSVVRGSWITPHPLFQLVFQM